MFDGVINHVSSKSRWFQRFLDGDPYYGEFFMAYHSPDDLTPEQKRMIFRPRTSNILTLVNVTDRACRVEVPLGELDTEVVRWYDLVSGVEWMADKGTLWVSLEPYGVVWLESFRKGAAKLSVAP